MMKTVRSHKHRMGLFGIALMVVAGMLPSLGVAQPAGSQPATTQHITKNRPPIPGRASEADLEAARKAAMQGTQPQPAKSDNAPGIKPGHSEPVLPHGVVPPSSAVHSEPPRLPSAQKPAPAPAPALNKPMPPVKPGLAPGLKA